MKRFGLIQLPVLLGLVLLIVAIPVSVRMVQESQDTRNKAFENPPYPSQYFAKIDGVCQSYMDLFMCEQANPGTTCYSSLEECESAGSASPTSPPEIANLYLCDATPNQERQCDINNKLTKTQCEEMTANNSNLSCKNSCSECLLVYSVCLPKSLLDKCPDGFKSQDPECKHIFGGSNYYYGDREYQFEARCSSFEGMLYHECVERFGSNNCFMKNTDCMGNCPVYDEEEEIKAYSCGENQSCLPSVYDSFEDCYKENGMLGCYGKDWTCGGDCNDSMVDYYYCEYNQFGGTGKKGSFRNIYECYSKYEKCSSLSYEGRPCPPKDDSDKKIKLYFCGDLGCRWEIFKNWKECGDKHGVCYDSANQCKLGSRCPIILPEMDFYYIDENYSLYIDQCRKKTFYSIQDCKIFVNGCEEGMTIDYCKKIKGDNFKENVCFMDSNCGRNLSPTPTLPPGDDEDEGCQPGVKDLNEDEVVNEDEFEIWKDEYFNKYGEESYTWVADFNCNGRVDLVDFEIWRSYFFDESNWEKIKCVFNDEEFKFNDSICKNDGVSMRCNSKGEWDENTCEGEDVGCFSGNCVLTKCNINGEKYNLDQSYCSGNLEKSICKPGGIFVKEKCPDGWRCVGGECEEVKCEWKDIKYRVGTKICKSELLPAICQSNGEWQDSVSCDGKMTECKEGSGSCGAIPGCLNEISGKYHYHSDTYCFDNYVQRCDRGAWVKDYECCGKCNEYGVCDTSTGSGCWSSYFNKMVNIGDKECTTDSKFVRQCLGCGRWSTMACGERERCNSSTSQCDTYFCIYEGVDHAVGGKICSSDNSKTLTCQWGGDWKEEEGCNLYVPF